MEGCKSLPGETLTTYPGRLTSSLKTAGEGNGEMVALLRALTALAENWGLVPSTQMAAPKHLSLFPGI